MTTLYGQPNLIYLQAPKGEAAQDSLITLIAAPLPPVRRMPDSCGVLAASVPAGDKAAGHGRKVAAERNLSSDSSAVIFRFRGTDKDTAGGGKGPQFPLGFQFLVVACRDGKDVAPELPLLVSTRQAASFLTPRAQETSSSPNISWTAVPGVPAYHLLLSDQALEIDAEKGSVSGASVIWQAITTRTSLAYGTPDPSGNFAKVPAPPLSPNVPYNLVILNNYDGRSTLATSTKAQGLKLFTVQSAGPVLSAPRNLAPSQGKTLSAAVDSMVQFRWTASKGEGARANTYKVYVYSREVQDQSEVLLPIWQTEVTDTSAVMDGKRTLLDKRYIWKVFAVGETGAGVVGDTTSFVYRNDVQTLSLAARVLSGAGDTVQIGDVKVEVTPQDGGADPLPLFTLSSGRVERTLAMGAYTLDFSKAGYLTQRRAVTLAATPLRVDQFLPAASCRVTGRMADGEGKALVNVTLSAAGDNGPVSAVSDAQGFFLLGLGPGSQVLSCAKPDFQSRPDTLLTLAPGKNVDLGTLVLQAARGSLTGTVVNDKGAPLSACQVAVKGAAARTLLTDDQGGFSAFLAPGAYTVTASRTGFTSEEKTLQLNEAVNLRFQLLPGASVVKGRVTMTSFPAAGSPQNTPLPGAALTLRSARGGLQRAEADLRGEFSFSADTGAYVLTASLDGKARADSVTVRVAAPRSTVAQDLALRGLAAVQGTLKLIPPAAVDPATATVTLLRSPTLQFLVSAVPVRQDTNLAYSLEGVPDGAFRVTCGLPGYGLESEPVITVANGVWVRGLELTLRQANKSLTCNLAHAGKPVTGTVKLRSPRQMDLASGQKLTPAAPGTYVLDALPDSADLIPLVRYSFSLPVTGAADTSLSLSLPFAHSPGPLSFRDGAVSVSLRMQARPDSVLVVYGYGAPLDTVRASPSLLSIPGPAVELPLRPGPQGGLLTYYFVIRSGNLAFANDAPARRFHAPVATAPGLASLRLDAGDSLNLPARSRCLIRIHAYDAAGNRLDTAVDKRAAIAWDEPAALGRREGKPGRTLTLSTGAPAVPTRSGRAAWDTASVTVTLDGMAKTLRFPVRVVPARVNRITLTSSLGEASEVNAPPPFSLFVSGFDTTASPPTPLLPNAVLALDPPEAGSVQEGTVTLDRRFIGPLRILATHAEADGSLLTTELGAGRDSLLNGLNVGQTLRAGDSAAVLFHDPEFEMRLPDSALASGQAVLRLYRRKLSKSFTSRVHEVLAGQAYEISNPGGAVFSAPPLIRLGIPRPFRGRANALRRFDAARLDWFDLDTASADTNGFGGPALAAQADSLDGSYYGLLSRSRSLSAGGLEIVPNPFSPLVLASRDGNTQYGARIRFRPDSDESAEVTVSLKIYNLEGELVRLLTDHKTVPKAPVDFYWDGRTDSGRWARNGRYLVKISLTSTGAHESRHLVKPVVVFQ